MLPHLPQLVHGDFYPRPPGGGRPIDVSVTNPLFRFLSTPSGWRATAKRALGLSKTPHFYPRPPGGGRLVRCSLLTSTWAISIHALRVEGDSRTSKTKGRITHISIHALRVEGDSLPPPLGRPLPVFLSTPSGWRATQLKKNLHYRQNISIHALRVEGDKACSCIPGITAADFYPRPPGGGRQ